MPSSNINTTRTHHQRRRYAFAAAHLASTMMAFNHCQTALAFTLRRSSSSASAFLVNNSGKKTTRQIITAATTTTSTNTRLFSSVTEQQPKSSSSLANNNNNDDGSIYKLKPRPTPTRDTQYDLTNLSNGIQGSYDPTLFESQLYQWWEEAGCFEPDAKQSAATSSHNQKEPYVLPMPPPNVTGRLHMGHAIFVALQDVLARFHRMRGRPVLWTPGTDHAGIATQLQVEKALLIEGKRRGTDEEIANAPNDEERNKLVPRNEFLERVWQYKEEQGGAITSQLRSLGASADWTRERFTMDPALSVGVSEAFVRLHEKGLVYRGTYMVNWSPGLMTAVSDLEVEYSEEEGKLYYFKYVVEDEEEVGKATEEFLPVATTRPETIFGDTAVCVNPNDERYSHLIGKRVLVPISETSSGGGGKARSIPIIADEYVDMEFGTGALKITPGHDPNDYELGKKYDLEIMNVMNKDATMNEKCGERYVGLDRFEAREKLWSDMEEAGLVIKAEPHTQRVPRSQRGGEIIEPLVSKQWFVKTDGMGAKALAAVKDGDITIVPSRFEKVWYGWLTDIRDWCISRQLWWGHRIPVWYVDASEEEYIVARNEEEAKKKAVEAGHPADIVLRQEEDVLDTWFSSGLWPFATVGWPQDEGKDASTDLSRFYPGTCLETGYDILFFWVARMVMLGIELTDVSPFKVIYLHGLVRAADGSKMSKTKGNVLDPLDTVAEYGADSLRYSLVTGVTPGQDIPLNMEKIAANKAFANKLWNCCKFVTGNALKDVDEEEMKSLGVSGPIGKEEFDTLPLPERYIISKCHELVESVTEDIEKYQLGAAGSKVSTRLRRSIEKKWLLLPERFC
jgi:valyl-tRNA synthetase